MRKFFRSAFAAALVLILTPQFAPAGEGEKGDWELGYYAGWAKLDDYDNANPEDEAFIGVRAGYFFSPLWSGEASYQQLTTLTDFAPSLGLANRDFDIESLRLNLLANFRPGKTFRPFITAGLGSEHVDVGGSSDNEAELNVGAGLRWFMSRHFGFRLDGRFVKSESGGTGQSRQSNHEGSLGLMWAFGGGPALDSDGDGVPDRRDGCPDTPRGATVDAKGCPTDSDGDGVVDGLDSCPDTPKGWPVDEKGCPKDSDGDGVPDGDDDCPATPRGATVNTRGCPTDSDQDGVWDGIDRCPDTPRGAKVDERGCPLDSDGDGVVDGIDRCPNTPRGEEVDAQGCSLTPPPPPKAPPLFEETKRNLILEGVNFEVDKAVLTSASTVVLDRVAASLRDWPEVRISIEGHTDSSGSSRYNLDLSRRRAEAVKAYLITKGVDASRMTTKGFGEKTPIADNATVQGKAKNRRVELTRTD